MTNALEALQESVNHLREITGGLSESQLVASAHPTQWTVADVLSHLGSAAIIAKRRLDDGVEGREMPPEFPQSVWDVWNLKTPHAQATDSLLADAALQESIDETTPEQRDAFSWSLGPIDLDFDGFVSMRLGEHALHTWDIEEAFDKDATLQRDAVPIIIDNLELLIRFTAKSNDSGETLLIRTTEPQREFALTLGTDGVTLELAEASNAHNLELSAEAFIRLVYGRLDEEHTPASVRSEHLQTLRAVFPGM
ncbi:MAG: maleylpyruvate isomerase family mycothiol-dependent enzyme [Acidimicrobiales bacterium]